MINLIDAERIFGKMQSPFIIEKKKKTSQKTKNRGELLQPDREHL